MVSIEIKDARIARAFEELSRTLSDMSGPMHDIGDHMLKSTQDRMAAGLSVDGTPFAPRSPVTLAIYAIGPDKFGPKPLWKSGVMRSQIHFSAGADHAEIGTNAIQAAVMHFGATQGEFGARMGRTRPKKEGVKPRDYFVSLPWGDIPARPFLGVSEQDSTHILDILTEWIATATDLPDTGA